MEEKRANAKMPKSVDDSVLFRKKTTTKNSIKTSRT